MQQFFFQPASNCSVFFFKFIYLYFYAALCPRCFVRVFSLVAERVGLLFSCGGQAFHHGGITCGAQGSRAQAWAELWCMAAASRHGIFQRTNSASPTLQVVILNH